MLIHIICVSVVVNIVCLNCTLNMYRYRIVVYLKPDNRLKYEHTLSETKTVTKISILD